MHSKMKCKFSNSNEYYLQKGARGFKQSNKCKIQCKKHKIFFAQRAYKSKRLQNIRFMTPKNTLHFTQKVRQKHSKKRKKLIWKSRFTVTHRLYF